MQRRPNPRPAVQWSDDEPPGEHDEEKAREEQFREAVSGYLTVQQAADWHGTTRQAISRALREGRIAGIQIAGRWMLSPAAVRAYQPLPVTGRGKKAKVAT